MFLGNEEKVYILDKAENNAEVIGGHAAWGAVWFVAPLHIDLALELTLPRQGCEHSRA
jgi:hypothetical protein